MLPVPNCAATFRTSTLAAPLARISSGAPSRSNTRLLVMAATSQPSAVAAAAAVGTVESNTVTVSSAPSTVNARFTRATGSGTTMSIPQNPWASRMASSSSSAVAFFRLRGTGRRRATGPLECITPPAEANVAGLRFGVLGVDGGVAGLLTGGVPEADEHQHAEGKPLQRVGQVCALLGGRLGEREGHLRHGRAL